MPSVVRAVEWFWITRQVAVKGRRVDLGRDCANDVSAAPGGVAAKAIGVREAAILQKAGAV